MGREKLKGALEPYVPWATYAIIGLNLAVYGWLMMVFLGRGIEGVAGVFDAFGLRITEDTRWYRIVGTMFTMMWLHSPAPDHVGSNMLLLYFTGPPVEQAMGRRAYVAAYVLGNIGACLLHWIVLSIAGMSLARPVIGASGAVSVIMGAFAVRFYRTPLYITPRRRVQFPAAVILGAFLGHEVRRGLLDAFTSSGAGGVANWAHVGGFFAGAAVSFATGGVRQARRNVLMQRKAASGQGDEAMLEELAGIVRRDPEDGDAGFRLAFELDRTGQEPELAVRYYASAIRALALQGNRRRAIEVYVAFAQAHEFAGLSPSVHAIVVACYETTEQYEAALRVCELIVEAFPDHRAEAEAALAKAMDIAADVLRDFPRAQAAAVRLLAAFPGSPHTEKARRLAAAGRAS